MLFIRSAACAALVLASAANADVLYATTATQLVRFDSSNPGIFTPIGSHGRTGSLVAMTFDPSASKFYALEYDLIGGNSYNQYLIAIDPLTGASTLSANLGISTDVGFFESLEYVHSRNALVASKAPVNDIFNTTALYAVSHNGALSLLANSGRDNDASVYDSTRDRFYGSDANGVGQLTLIDLSSGGIADIGPVPAFTGDQAYSALDDIIYMHDYINQRLFTISASGPHAVSLVGSLGESISTLATIPSPGAAALLGLSAIAAGARRRR